MSVYSIYKIRNHLIEYNDLKLEKARAYGLYDDLILLADNDLTNRKRISDLTDDLISSSQKQKIDEVTYVVYEDSSKKNKQDKTQMWLDFASSVFGGLAGAATAAFGIGGLGGSASSTTGLSSLLSGGGALKDSGSTSNGLSSLTSMLGALTSSNTNTNTIGNSSSKHINSI